jgi:hypothetical protein
MIKGIRANYGYLVIVTSVALLCYSIVSTSILWVEPTDLGLAGGLPITYWVGLLSVGVVWYIGRNKRFYLAVTLLLTVSYLYVAPAIIRVPTWISNSYYPFGESILINQLGHLVYRPTHILISYQDWPIFLYFASSLKLITGLPDAALVKLFPLFAASSYALFAVLILRIRMPISHAILGGAWFLGSFFIRQHYFGPQGFAYIYFLMGLLIVSWLFFESGDHRNILSFLLVFLLVLTTLTHPLTSLMLLTVLLSVYLTYRFITKKASSLIVSMCLLSVLVWLGYNGYFAPSFFNQTTRNLFNVLFGEESLGIYSEPSRLIGSRAMLWNFVASWGTVILGAGLAALSVLLILRKTLKKQTTSRLEYSAFISIMLLMLGFFSFSVEYGAVEAYQRAFMFGLVPVSYLCVDLLSKRQKVLILLLVGLLFLNIPAQYGSDTYRLATDSTLDGAAFFADHSPEEIRLIGKLTLYIRYHDPPKVITEPALGIAFPYTSLPNASAVNDAFLEALKETDYIELSGLEKNFYLFYIGSNPLERVDIEGSCSRVYDNSRYWVFKPANVTSP